jgi:hypothetical protein
MMSVGIQVGAAIGGTAILNITGGSSSGNTGGNAGVGVSSLTSGDTATTALNFGVSSTGRQSWREIFQ